MFMSKPFLFIALALAGLTGCAGTAAPTLLTGAPSAGASSAAAGKAPSTALIVDGSFEKPVAPSGSYLTFSTGENFNGWTVSGASGNVAVIGKNFTYEGFTLPAGCGKQFLDLTGSSNSLTGVEQTVATTPNANYILSFKVGNTYKASSDLGTSSTVLVYIDGNKALKATNKKGKGKTRLVWKAFSKTFTAKSAQTTINFVNGDPSTDTANGLDCITMVPTT
jgi:hypothetical protein